ncbi:extensin-2-like [Copidosoma floridanum]|uniref:extensin-2-like n=1 Tax=Copidosoma floridanum TaxID=29053 RepID=UPI0006C9A05E|nr:extensin-2-like [Copidosoma floridanum]
MNDHARLKRQSHEEPQHVPLQHINYRPYNEAPDKIKQLLKLQQAREPLVYLAAQPPPQLQAASAPGIHRTPPPQQVQPQQPLIQPAQYSPKVQYNQAPPQPTYKGIQAIQAGAQPDSPPASQNYYTPQYKSQYNLHQQQSQPNALPNANYRPVSAVPPAGLLGQYRGAPSPQQPPAQFPKNLPPHIQKIIESQRAYQGGPMSPILTIAYDKRWKAN